jgi:hypothetical protein
MDRTELGGADAPLTIEETIPRLVNVLLDKRQRPGLEYLDYQGRTALVIRAGTTIIWPPGS